MNELVIRKEFHKKILAHKYFEPNSLIVDELGIIHGKCIADIAVINNDFYGFEIKSEKDSLRRLEQQAYHYNKVFDFASIILSECHLDEAAIILPNWWGIIVASYKSEADINFLVEREAKQNPGLDGFAIAQLL